MRPKLKSRLNDLVKTWEYSSDLFKAAAAESFSKKNQVDKAWGYQYEGEHVAYRLCAKHLRELIKDL